MRKTKEKLFVKKHPDALHSKGILIRLTEQEKAQIQKSAHVRNLATSEFVRRAALGRRADVSYETDTVLALSALTRSVRELHAACVAQGVAPPEDAMLPILQGAKEAMLRISK